MKIQLRWHTLKTGLQPGQHFYQYQSGNHIWISWFELFGEKSVEVFGMFVLKTWFRTEYQAKGYHWFIKASAVQQFHKYYDILRKYWQC